MDINMRLFFYPLIIISQCLLFNLANAQVFNSANNEVYSKNSDAPDVSEKIDNIEAKFLPKIKEKKLTLSTPIIYKSFKSKRPRKDKEITIESNSEKEIYINHEGKDYFVKFCTSDIKRATLDKALAHQLPSRVLTLAITLKKGSFDICNGDYSLQSRQGSYAVIHQIINNIEVSQ